jgi:hypothetical protein
MSTFKSGDRVALYATVVGQGPIGYLVKTPSGRNIYLYKYDVVAAPKKRREPK